SYWAKVESNKTYTISRSNDNNNRFRIVFLDKEPVSGIEYLSIRTRDSYLEDTFTTSSDVTHVLIYLQYNEPVSGDEPNVQLEKGNKATDWTPAPEDMDERMTKAESSITQNATNIDLKVNVDEIVSEINLEKEGIRIAGDLIHLDGLALIDDAVIKSAHIANTTIEKGHLKEAIIDDAHIDELTGKSIVAKTITTDHLDVAKLSSIAADLGVVTAGILESKNNNMRLNLNTGNLTM